MELSIRFFFHTILIERAERCGFAAILLLFRSALDYILSLVLGVAFLSAALLSGMPVAILCTVLSRVSGLPLLGAVEDLTAVMMMHCLETLCRTNYLELGCAILFQQLF